MRYLKSLPSAVALAAVVALGACSGEEPAGDPSSSAAHSFGLMSVSYTHDSLNSSADGLELTTTAQFVRYSALERKQVARLLALPLDPDADLPASDHCKLYDLTVDLGEQGLEPADSATVDLLEAGDLTVETSGGTLKLEPRHFPGLLPFISGVAYGEAQSDRAPKTGRVFVSTPGGEAVGAFRVDAPSPELPRIRQIAGGTPDREPVLSQSQGLAVSWRPAEEASRHDEDVLYLEARIPSGKRDLVLRCSPRDDGSFTIAAQELDTLRNNRSKLADHRMVVELIRLRRSYFAARGLDSAELRITVRDRTSLQLR